MIDPADVTAVIVTRGNVQLDDILSTLKRYPRAIVWDNSAAPADYKVFGRYVAAGCASTRFVYWQDDDVVQRHHDTLLELAEPGMLVTVNAHGADAKGYDDVALVGAGAICDRQLMQATWGRYYRATDLYVRIGAGMLVGGLPDLNGLHDEVHRRFARALPPGLLYEADFVFGTLVDTVRTVDVDYERLYADDDSRLCRQPWQEELKREWTEHARSIRDGNPTPPPAARATP